MTLTTYLTAGIAMIDFLWVESGTQWGAFSGLSWTGTYDYSDFSLGGYKILWHFVPPGGPYGAGKLRTTINVTSVGGATWSIQQYAPPLYYPWDNGASVALSDLNPSPLPLTITGTGTYTFTDLTTVSLVDGYIGFQEVFSLRDPTGPPPPDTLTFSITLLEWLLDAGGDPIVVYDSSAPVGFTGDLDKTLGGLTLLASGYLERLGALNQTFPALSVQATGLLSAYHVPTLINVRDITASGTGAIGVDVVNNAISQNVRANSLQVENGGSLEAHSVYYDTITTIGTGTIVPLRSDRAVWDVANYADRHASDITGSTWAYHRNPALSGSYTVDHPSVRRILDVTSVSLNEMAALLGTLLDDLGLT